MSEIDETKFTLVEPTDENSQSPMLRVSFEKLLLCLIKTLKDQPDKSELIGPVISYMMEHLISVFGKKYTVGLIMTLDLDYVNYMMDQKLPKQRSIKPEIYAKVAEMAAEIDPSIIKHGPRPKSRGPYIRME
jgi:hypothetical protein